MTSTTGPTKGRNIRIGDELWEDAKRTAAGEGVDLSQVVRDLLTDYVAGLAPGNESGYRDGITAARDHLGRALDQLQNGLTFQPSTTREGNPPA